MSKKEYHSTSGTIALWSSPDVLILKVLTILIQRWLNPSLSKACYRLKGHAGLKKAVNEVLTYYPKYRFFCKTDVKEYCDSIDHNTLLIKMHTYIKDNKIISYICQFLNRCVKWGGLYEDTRRGIRRGSSLSPLLGAFYLLDLDREMEKMDVKYFRYMDDILILAPSRWKLKRAIRLLNQTLNELKLEKPPGEDFYRADRKGI